MPDVYFASDVVVQTSDNEGTPVSLIEAQRSLISLRDRNFEATADYFRRRASLDRLVGQVR